MYANTIRILLEGYLLISLLPLMKVKEILDKVKKAVQITNLYYDTVVKDYICIMIWNYIWH